MSDAEAAPPPRPDLVAVGLAVTILVIVTIVGVSIFVPLGIVAGPSADVALTPRLARRLGRHYTSPGAALWSLTFAAVSFLPTVAIAAASTARARDQALAIALGLTAPGIILGVYARRGGYAKLGLVGGLASVAMSAVAFAISRTG